MESFNSALLAKWKWWFMSEEEGKWKDILKSKYVSETGSRQLGLKYQSWRWRDIIKVCGEGEQEGWFHKAVGWKVGDGGIARFWEDVWLQNNCIKTLYPRLYALSLDQGKTVEEVGRWEDGLWRWRLNWRRERYVWEENMEGELFSSLTTGVIRQEVQDHLVWRGDPKGVFSVKSTYSFLDHHQTNGVADNVFGTLWLLKAMPKVLITVWRVLLDRLPTTGNLIRRGVSVDSSLCVLCKVSEESSQHLFLDCEHAQRIWYFGSPQQGHQEPLGKFLLNPLIKCAKSGVDMGSNY